MENNIQEMKSWRIDMARSKRGEVTHVGVYTNTTTVLVFLFTIGIIATGSYMIHVDPNILRITLMILGLAISLPYTFVCVTSKSRLKKYVKRGYRPVSDIDSDRYVITMDYFGLTDLVKTKDLTNDGDLTSDFMEKRKLRERKSIFSGLQRRFASKVSKKMKK